MAVSCGVGRRHGLDLAFLWLWRRPAAVAPIRPLPWEPPYATGEALKRQKDKKKERKKAIPFTIASKTKFLCIYFQGGEICVH